jgi:EmrB/QacA subfamily drug resistance transporter
VQKGTEGPRRLRRLIPGQRATAIVYSVSLFMANMDTQIVNVALPTLSREFKVSTDSVQWVVTSYLMSIAVCVPASGWLGDRFGTKRLHLTAIGLFTGASLLCAISTSLPELVAMRVVQGLGGGMMVPVGMAMLYRAYPPARRVQVARLITRVTVLGPTTAPIIGGVLVTYASWRWIFTINVPFGILLATVGLLCLEEHREPRLGTFDLFGALSGAVGLGLLLYTVGSGPTNGWGSPLNLTTGAIAIGALAFFFRLELRRPNPLLNLHLLSNRQFRRGVGLSFTTVLLYGSLVFTALYLQETRGLSALQSGITTFPEALGIGFSSQIVARLFPRVGPRRLIVAGFLGFAVMMTLFAHVGISTNLWQIRLYCFCLGISASYVSLPNQASSFSQISSASTGHAAAIFGATQRVMSSLGVALLSAVLALAGGDALHVRPPVSAFHWVYTANLGLALIGVCLALRIRDEDAALAMGRGPTTNAQTPGATSTE